MGQKKHEKIGLVKKKNLAEKKHVGFLRRRIFSQLSEALSTAFSGGTPAKILARWHCICLTKNWQDITTVSFMSDFFFCFAWET